MGKIHSFESFGTVDGPGIRTVVFFQGCPLRCLYCHNPDSRDMDGGTEMTVEEVAAEVLKYKSYFGERGGVTVSGGEPLAQLDFLIELFTYLKERGINTCCDTSGIYYRADDKRFKKLLKVTDLFLLDIKHADEKNHVALTGGSGTAPREFAKFLSDKKKPMWIRYVLVPGYTDSDEALFGLKEFISTLNTVKKIELLPYHTMGAEKYKNLGIAYPLEGVNPPDSASILKARNILNGKITKKGEII